MRNKNKPEICSIRNLIDLLTLSIVIALLFIGYQLFAINNHINKIRSLTLMLADREIARMEIELADIRIRSYFSNKQDTCGTEVQQYPALYTNKTFRFLEKEE